MNHLAEAWSDAAAEYERYLVPRFAPWVAAAAGALAGDLPPGPLLVPCCGTFPELPALVAAHPDREIVGIDLSPGMVTLAAARTSGHPLARAEVGDAAELAPAWRGTCAGLVSVFGLQQLPDPAGALTAWVGALRPGGRLSVMYWPDEVETDGPFALVADVLAAHRPPRVSPAPDRLAEVVAAAGAVVEHAGFQSFPMHHESAAAFWAAWTTGGPLRALANARGPEFIDALGAEFVHRAPAGPWSHEPRARWLVARQPA
jgi:SAM-dependent methyltransferase